MRRTHLRNPMRARAWTIRSLTSGAAGAAGALIAVGAAFGSAQPLVWTFAVCGLVGSLLTVVFCWSRPTPVDPQQVDCPANVQLDVVDEAFWASEFGLDLLALLDWYEMREELGEL